MGLKSTIFGQAPQPSKNSYSSSNQAYPAISSAFTPDLNYVSQGGNLMGAMLGANGQPAQLDALNNFANSGGMNFLEEQGQKGITAAKAAQGLLDSGSYGEAMDKFNQGLASTYLNQYMNDLMGYSDLGIKAGQVMAGAGQQSQGSGTGATQGKQGILPSLISAGAGIATGGASLPFTSMMGGMMSPTGLDSSVLGSMGGGSPMDILTGAGLPTF